MNFIKKTVFDCYNGANWNVYLIDICPHVSFFRVLLLFFNRAFSYQVPFVEYIFKKNNLNSFVNQVTFQK